MGRPYFALGLLGLPCPRAPRPKRSHLRTWPACSWLVPSLSFRCRRPRSPACHARCRACVDRRHRRQFCSPQPWQLRARASSIRRRRHLTPRAGQRHQPLTARPNRPSLAPSPPAPPIRSHPLLQPMQRQHHVRGRADWRTCSQPCLPLPTGLDPPAPPAVSNLEGMLGWTIVSRHPTATTPSSWNRSCDRARRLGLLLPNHQSSSLPPHPLPFWPYSLWMFAPMYHICSCVMKRDR